MGPMRKALLFSLLILMLVASGCSYSSDLVVINLSDKAVEVRYRFVEYPHDRGNFEPPDWPAIKTAKELTDDVAWRDLAMNQYGVDVQSRSVRLTLAPQTALRMARISNRGVSKQTVDPNFPLIELVMRGANGTVVLQGEQVQFSFNEETRQTYSIAYR